MEVHYREGYTKMLKIITKKRTFKVYYFIVDISLSSQILPILMLGTFQQVMIYTVYFIFAIKTPTN